MSPSPPSCACSSPTATSRRMTRAWPTPARWTPTPSHCPPPPPKASPSPRSPTDVMAAHCGPWKGAASSAPLIPGSSGRPKGGTVKIEPFALERWMTTYETRVQYDIAESGICPLTANDLLAMAPPGERDGVLAGLLDLPLGYSEARGTEELRA